MLKRNRIFIDGGWTAASGDGLIEVINPATEEVIAAVPCADAKDVALAVQSASNAFANWSRSPLQERTEIFRNLARLTKTRAEDIARTIVSEVGQPLTQARPGQVAGAVEELEIIADSLNEIAWSEQIGNTLVRRAAAGVVGAITPWNSPLRAIVVKAGAAMAAGCTVVLKASEIAPLSAYMFAEMTIEAGLPKGVFNLVCGTGPVTGEALVSHPNVDVVSLTGSVRAGRRVMALASEGIKRVHLELGGKSANIIFDDADFGRAVVDGIEDAFRNAGQVCGGLTRMLVPRSRLRETEELAVAKAESYVLGDPLDRPRLLDR